MFARQTPLPLFYGGGDEYEVDGIRVLPLAIALPRMGELLGGA